MEGFFLVNENIDYIRVTHILSYFSGLNKINPEILQNAADRGKEVHDICIGMLQNIGECSMREDTFPYVDSFKKWFYDHLKQVENVHFIFPDRFYCDKYKITGECDFLYKDKEGALVLADLKTSAKENKTWLLQGSAYAYLAEKAGYEIDKIQFIKLSKTGEYPQIFEYEENFEMFLRIFSVYKEFFHYKNDDSYLDYL
jgi:hypothetical protein